MPASGEPYVAGEEVVEVEDGVDDGLVDPGRAAGPSVPLGSPSGCSVMVVLLSSSVGCRGWVVLKVVGGTSTKPPTTSRGSGDGDQPVVGLRLHRDPALDVAAGAARLLRLVGQDLHPERDVAGGPRGGRDLPRLPLVDVEGRALGLRRGPQRVAVASGSPVTVSKYRKIVMPASKFDAPRALTLLMSASDFSWTLSESVAPKVQSSARIRTWRRCRR
jgi:hypothetical protein